MCVQAHALAYAQAHAHRMFKELKKEIGEDSIMPTSSFKHGKWWDLKQLLFSS